MRIRVRNLVGYIPSSKMLSTATYSAINGASNGVKNGSECVKDTPEDVEVREAKLFNETFDLVTKKLTSKNDPDLGPVSDWMRKVIRTICLLNSSPGMVGCRIL